MPLPKGFGHEPKVEPPRKCRLGKICYKGFDGDKCPIHQWTWRHDEAYMAIKLIVFLGACCVALVWWAFDNSVQSTINQLEFFDSISCPEVFDIIKNHDHTHKSWNDYYEARCT